MGQYLSGTLYKNIYNPQQEIVSYFLECCMDFENEINSYKNDIPFTLNLDLLNKIESSLIVNATFENDRKQ